MDYKRDASKQLACRVNVLSWQCCQSPKVQILFIHPYKRFGLCDTYAHTHTSNYYSLNVATDVTTCCHVFTTKVKKRRKQQVLNNMYSCMYTIFILTGILWCLCLHLSGLITNAGHAHQTVAFLCVFNVFLQGNANSDLNGRTCSTGCDSQGG